METGPGVKQSQLLDPDCHSNELFEPARSAELSVRFPDMPDSYCHSCYRTVPSGMTTCSSCSVEVVRVNAGRAVLAGAAGLPLLLAGMLTMNLRLCVVAAIISLCSVVVYLVLT